MEPSNPASQAPDAALVPSSSTPPPGPSFPVVGLGASAGGLQALQAFFAHTPPDTGMAFVIILHLSPDYDSQAAAVLQAHTAMPVTQVTDAVPLAPNHVYVIPPAKQLSMVDGHLRLAEPVSEQERRVPIDHFFRTLAETHGSHAAAIILSGTGSDGVSGLQRVKERGGPILVQEPQEAEFDGMPCNAIATGLVDYVLPVAAMPEVLSAYWRRGAQLRGAATPGEGTDGDEAALREILALLRRRTTHDFSHYKRPTLLRRMERRMQVSGASDLSTYLELLRNRPDEVQALLGDLLISVTNFFRDPEAWTALQAIVPGLFANKGAGDQLRVWVSACATGEEAYSVAILLLEHARTLDAPPAIQVFASDINEAAIGRARQGSFSETIAGDVSAERLRQFFVAEQGRYRVTQELRDVVLFAHHNVLHDPPFGKLDLVTCRNLLIYLTRAAQGQVIKLFHFSLRPGGYLLLGSAETLDGVAQLFDVVAKGQRLFRQRATTATLPPAVPSKDSTSLSAPLRPARPTLPAGQASLASLHQRLMLQYAAPSVIVNADYEIVHLSPGAGRFLLLEAGEPSVNLLRAAHPDLRLELQSALFQAAQHGQRTESPHLRVRAGDTVRLIDISVEPIQERDWPGGSLFVRFNDVGAATVADGRALPDADARNAELEAELQRTRGWLQLTVEAYETVGEEHKAANEELTAINEELRAASEELETSKEELQAINEELRTVNQELKHQIAETTHANNDLQNLIAATEIGTLFLDRALRITRYTPSVERLFNLIPSDLARPLSHVTHSLDYQGLAADAKEVLATLTPTAREVQSRAGQWYLVQLRAYRTIDDRIAGVVITFVDITERKKAEDALAQAFATEQQAHAALEDAGRLKDQFLATVSHELRTPITAMLGYAHLLTSRSDDAAYVASTTEKLTRSAKAQAQLVEDLLDVARSFSGTLRVALAPVALGPVVQAAIDTVRPAIDAKGVELRMALSHGDTMVLGDAQRLQQVVWNLLSNAGKFTPAGGRVDVELQALDVQVQLLVRDTGQGIPAAFLPHVFERFRQADGTSTRSAEGLGLGLAIVRQLIELHGGTVEVHSAGVGQGTTARVVLPRAAMHATMAVQPPSALAPAAPHARLDGEAELAGLRVLIVDDQAEILDLLDDSLRACGADVRPHATAEAALAELRAWQPHVLICDIAMPGRDGYWLIEQVRALPAAEGGTIPALALTAYVRVEERLRVLHAGFQLFVPKPVDPQELCTSVVRLVGMDKPGDG